MSATFTAAQLAYLDQQILGRIATIGADGPQVRPVGYSVDADAGVIEIGGHDLPSPRKWKNVRADGRVAFVVDDLDQVHAAVVARGHPLAEPLQRRPWDLTDFRIFDPDRYYLRITHHPRSAD
jgi:PPOX class F420-dependent enzyme/OxyR family protein